MNVLLDTHSLLWFLNGDIQLSVKAKDTILQPDSKLYLSIASIWEIAIKLSIGKLNLDMSFEDLKQDILLSGFEILPIEFEHLQTLIHLTFHHRDPFDRIIIAQAITEDMTLISKDEHFNKYEKLNLLWE